MSKVPNDVADRIRKLHSMATKGDGHEATSAQAMRDKLLQKYGAELHDAGIGERPMPPVGSKEWAAWVFAKYAGGEKAQGLAMQFSDSYQLMGSLRDSMKHTAEAIDSGEDIDHTKALRAMAKGLEALSNEQLRNIERGMIALLGGKLSDEASVASIMTERGCSKSQAEFQFEVQGKFGSAPFSAKGRV